MFRRHGRNPTTVGDKDPATAGETDPATAGDSQMMAATTYSLMRKTQPPLVTHRFNEDPLHVSHVLPTPSLTTRSLTPPNRSTTFTCVGGEKSKKCVWEPTTLCRSRWISILNGKTCFPNVFEHVTGYKSKSDPRACAKLFVHSGPLEQTRMVKLFSGRASGKTFLWTRVWL